MNITDYIVEIVDHDKAKSAQNVIDNDFSAGEYAEEDGKGGVNEN